MRSGRKPDVMANAAGAVALDLIRMFIDDGRDIDELRSVFNEVEALADGSSTNPSANAVTLYGHIRQNSKASAGQAREFIGLIAESLRQVEVVRESEAE